MPGAKVRAGLNAASNQPARRALTGRAHGKRSMSQQYTLATYRVIPGKEDDFIRTWNDLAATFKSLPDPPQWGVLLRSIQDPALFHSFGPWDSAEHIATMRKSPEAMAAFKALQDLCIDMLPGDYEVVATVRVHDNTDDEPVQEDTRVDRSPEGPSATRRNAGATRKSSDGR